MEMEENSLFLLRKNVSKPFENREKCKGHENNQNNEFTNTSH